MKATLIVLGALALSGCVTAERRISVADYRDKMAAGWVGQIAGVGLGGPTEFQYSYKPVPPERVRAWSPEIINEAFNQDDLYVEMTFLRTLETKGLDVGIREAGIDFANSRYRLWHANAEGRNNLRRGIAPPDSAHPANNGCANCIDYQIEADYSGLVSPGLPQGAVDLGETFGRLMNSGDGLYAGQFVGALYSAAFFESDPEAIVREALRAIPAESRYAEMVRDCLKWHAEKPDDWKYGFDKIIAAYGHEKDHNGVSCAVLPNVIEATLNGAMVLLGVLWGDGDLDKTIRYSCYGGFDSDCNPSTAGGVIFTTKGLKALPKAYVEKLDRVTKFEYTDYNFDNLVDVCEKIAREVVVKSGGRVVREKDGEWFVLPVKAPVPSPLESFTKPRPLVGARYTEAECARILFRPDDPKADSSKRWGIGSTPKTAN